jgi:hypothetical protein
MLDPKEQAKGGFRAHAEREQKWRDALAAAGTPEVPGADGQADGAAPPEPPAPDGERSPYAPDAPSAGRQPKRWR